MGQIEFFPIISFNLSDNSFFFANEIGIHRRKDVVVFTK